MAALKAWKAKQAKEKILLGVGYSDAGLVAERLGHSLAKITWDIYQHVTPAMQSNAAETVAGVIFRL